MILYITRHGESINNILDIIGGNSALSENGKLYAKFLDKYFRKTYQNKKIYVWTSMLDRTIETATYIKNKYHTQYGNLNEINAGCFEGFSSSYIKTYFPTIYKNRNNDKLNISYPDGENYIDLKKRVFPLLDTIDLTQEGVLLIISHQAVARIIYSYFTKNEINPYMQINLNTLYKFEKNNFIPISITGPDNSSL